MARKTLKGFLLEELQNLLSRHKTKRRKGYVLNMGATISLKHSITTYTFWKGPQARYGSQEHPTHKCGGDRVRTPTAGSEPAGARGVISAALRAAHQGPLAPSHSSPGSYSCPDQVTLTP